MICRHRYLMALVAALMVPLGFIGCGGDGDEGAQPGEVVAGTFVGEVREPTAAVAIAAAEPEPGEKSREVRATVYGGAPAGIERRDVPSERVINGWFKGSVDGNKLDLASEDGDRLRGRLEPDRATGTFELRDGRKVRFAVGRASGVADLYDVTVTPEGRVRGTSERGGRMRAQFPANRAGSVPLRGTVTPPDGEPSRFSASFFLGRSGGRLEEPVDAVFVVLPDGRIAGGPKRQQRTADFTCPLID